MEESKKIAEVKNKNLSNNKKMKYSAIELFPNSKRPRKGWSDKNNLTKLPSIDIYVKHKKNPNKNCPNYSLVTGKSNDLSVIDLDFKTPEDKENHIFLKKWGSPTDWFKRWGSPVVQSASGGYHVYFKYDERIPTKASAGSVKKGEVDDIKIDTRGNSHKGVDGGLIVAPGSKLPKGEYKMINGHIDNRNILPEELYEWLSEIGLLSNKVGKKEQKVMSKKIQDGKTSFTVDEISGCDQSLYNYDFPDALLHNIIRGLPKSYFHTYQGYFLFATAMKQINRKDMYDLYPKLNNPAGGSVDSDEHKEWLDNHYNGITGHRTILAINHILMNTSFESARTSLDYYKYKPLLPNLRKPDLEVHKQKLGYTFLEGLITEYPTMKYFVIKSDTGTGKTTSFKHFQLNSGDFNFVSIVSRISLGLEQYNVFNKDGVDCNFYEMNAYEPDSGYVLQIDSLMKLYYWYEMGYLAGVTIFLDEFNSLVKHLLTSDTLTQKGTRIPVIELFRNILADAGKVFMTDADISDPAIEFLESVNTDKICYVKNTYNHNQGKPTQELFNVDELIKLMKDEPEWICACDWASYANMLKEAIGDEDIIVIDATTTERYEWDEHKRIIFSPKVIYGLDSVRERPVFCAYKENTIDAGDMLQQINRNRNITKLYYLFEKKRCQNTTYNTLKDAEEDTKDILKWCERNDHLHQQITQVHPIFQRIFNKYKYTRDCYMSNQYAHARRLMKERGFIVDNINFDKSDNQKSKKLMKENKERLIEEVTAELEYVKRKNEYIGLPDEEIENFKAIFVDTQFIARYVACKKYLFETQGVTYNPEIKEWESKYENEILAEIEKTKDYKNKILNSSEFNIKKIQTTNNRLVYLDKLRDAIGQQDKLKINEFTVLDEQQATTFMSEYRATFNFRGKEDSNLLTTKLGTQQLINKIYKTLFGETPFKPIDTTIGGEKVRGFEDASIKDMGVMYEVFKVAQDKKVKSADKVYGLQYGDLEYSDESSDEE